MAAEDEEPAPALAAEQDAQDLRALLDTLPVATGVKDREGRWLYINAAATAGYGRSPTHMIGKLDRDVLPPGNDADAVLAADREVIDSGRSLTIPGHRFKTHEGREMVLHLVREPVRFQGAPAVLLTAHDVT
ncbi:MAG TPA: PAS domain-containing protein, partial [Polyangiales bacterium]